jgi:hypothetical protein
MRASFSLVFPFRPRSRGKISGPARRNRHIVLSIRHARGRIWRCRTAKDVGEVSARYRLLIEPDQGNGLDGPSRIMVDKVTTVLRSRLGMKVGVLDDASVLRLNKALVVFLGIADST